MLSGLGPKFNHTFRVNLKVVRATLHGGPGGGGTGNNRKKIVGEDGESGRNRPQLSLLVTALSAASAQQLLAPPSARASRAVARGEAQIYVERLTDLLWPMLSNLGFSGVVGVCAGVALKAVGRALMLLVGLAFCAVQVLAYTGVIHVEWSHLQNEVVRVLDKNRDRRVDRLDLQLHLEQLVAMASQGIPSVAGFMMGFALGLRL